MDGNKSVKPPVVYVTVYLDTKFRAPLGSVLR